MALTNEIGGFFVSLGLNPDKNSFETGNKLIDNVGNSLNKLIGAARNAAVVLATTAVAAGSVESKIYKTSESIGITTESFNLLRAAAKLAGVSSDGLLNSIGKLGGVLNRLKFDKTGVQAYQEQLWKLGIHFSEIKDMAADDAFGYIMKKAETLTDQYTTAELAARVEDVLGSDAMNFFIELQRQGVSYDQFLAGASRTQFTNAESNKKAAEFQKELNELKTVTESLGTRIGSDIGGLLTPYLETINTWFEEHGEEIAEKIVSLAEGMIKLVTKIVGNEDVKDIAKTAVESVKDTAVATKDMVVALAEGDLDAAADAFVEGAKAMSSVIEVTEDKMAESENPVIAAAGNKALDQAFMELVNNAADAVEDGAVRFWNWLTGKNKKDKKKMNDGILRPDGTITQVAPDDWVFAARNVGDLARAFIPHGGGQSIGAIEYSIVQNFTINGSNDMPQVLRQQAYNGVQEGLIAVMAQGSQRLQQMSGTR